MDVLFGNIIQIDAVNVSGGVYIFLHAGWSDCILHMLRNFEKAAAVPDAKRFHGRRDGKTDGFLGSFRVGYDQIFSHGIQPSGHTFYRGIERFQIDT